MEAGDFPSGKSSKVNLIDQANEPQMIPKQIEENKVIEVKQKAEFPSFEILEKQDDSTYDKMIGYCGELLETEKELSELCQKKVVMSVGLTGVGKSTLMNAIVSGAASMAEDDDHFIIATKKLQFNTRESFKIGEGTISCTKTPEFYLHKGIYFVDCPGVKDQDTSKQYIN